MTSVLKSPLTDSAKATITEAFVAYGSVQSPELALALVQVPPERSGRRRAGGNAAEAADASCRPRHSGTTPEQWDTASMP